MAAWLSLRAHVFLFACVRVCVRAGWRASGLAMSASAPSDLAVRQKTVELSGTLAEQHERRIRLSEQITQLEAQKGTIAQRCPECVCSFNVRTRSDTRRSD